MDIINMSILATHLKPSIYTTIHLCKNIFCSPSFVFGFFFNICPSYLLHSLITASHNLNCKLLGTKNILSCYILVQWDHEQWDPATTAPLEINTHNNIILTFQPFPYHFKVYSFPVFFKQSSGSCCLSCIQTWIRCQVLHPSALCTVRSLQQASSTEKSVLQQQQIKQIQTVFPLQGKTPCFCHAPVCRCSKVTGQQSAVHSISV